MESTDTIRERKQDGIISLQVFTTSVNRLQSVIGEGMTITGSLTPIAVVGTVRE